MTCSLRYASTAQLLVSKTPQFLEFMVVPWQVRSLHEQCDAAKAAAKAAVTKAERVRILWFRLSRNVALTAFFGP